MSDPRLEKSPDRFLFIGLLALLVWAPLPLGSNRPWAWSFMDVWVYLIAIAWLLMYMLKRVNLTLVIYKARPVVLLFGLWLVWVLLQMTPLPVTLVERLSPQAATHYAMLPDPPSWITISVEPHATQTGLLKSLACVLMFCLTLLLVNTRRRVKYLAYTLIVSGLFQAMYGSLMTLSGLEYGFFIKKTTAIGFAAGTFSNRNHFAGYLVMCLSTGIGIMVANLDSSIITGWRQRLHYLVKLALSAKLRLRLSLVIMVIALVLTHSRMGNSSFFASLLITGVIALVLSRYATRGTVILIASLVIIDIFLIGTWFGVEKVVERIEQTSMETEHRPEMYGHVRDQWSDYALTGSGLGSFYAVFPKYKTELEAGGFYTHAHNDYLEFASETGIIGLALLGAVVLLSWGTAVLAQYRRRDPLMRGISFAAIMGITALMIHSTVDFNLQIPANALTFMVLLAMAWMSLHMKHTD
jgi:putative inorganic carbon (HCO3(-)) transporter